MLHGVQVISKLIFNVLPSYILKLVTNLHAFASCVHQRLAAICLIRAPKHQRRPIIGSLTARGLPSWERNALALAYLPASSALVLHIGLSPLPRRCFGTQRPCHLGNVTQMVSYAAYKTHNMATRKGLEPLYRASFLLDEPAPMLCMAQNRGREPQPPSAANRFSKPFPLLAGLFCK